MKKLNIMYRYKNKHISKESRFVVFQYKKQNTLKPNEESEVRGTVTGRPALVGDERGQSD